MPFAFKQHYLKVSLLPENSVLFIAWHNSKACYNYKNWKKLKTVSGSF